MCFRHGGHIPISHCFHLAGDKVMESTGIAWCGSRFGHRSILECGLSTVGDGMHQMSGFPSSDCRDTRQRQRDHRLPHDLCLRPGGEPYTRSESRRRADHVDV